MLNGGVEDAASTSIAQRHSLDSSPAPTKKPHPFLCFTSTIVPLFILKRPWSVLEKNVFSSLFGTNPELNSNSPSKQSIQATFLLQLTGLTLLLPQAPHAPNPKATSFCQTAAVTRAPGKATKPRSHSAAMEKWNYSLNHAGLRPPSASGGCGLGRQRGCRAREGPAGLARCPQASHPRAPGSLTVSLKTPEKANANNSAQVCSSVSLRSQKPVGLEGKTRSANSTAPSAFQLGIKIQLNIWFEDMRRL